MRTNLSLRLLLADKDKEIERLNKMLDEKFMKENTFLVENGIICIKNKEIERLKKKLTEEKNAYINMYNMYVKEKEEIERLEYLNKQIVEECQNLDDEVLRLNNIINELEKWLNEWKNWICMPDEFEDGIISCINDTLDKLQELKGEKE